MMRFPMPGRRWAGAFILTLLAACASPPIESVSRSDTPTNAARHLAAPYVVLVSFDGFRYDYLDRYPAPNFQRVIREGARAERMTPVFPTKTFPTHYSIATGLYADRHGLVGNEFWDPERGALYALGDRDAVEDGSWYRGEPIWVTAETQGMRTAAYFFVGTEADVGGVRPSRWHAYEASVPPELRTDSALHWLALPEEQRPHLVLLYFSDTDQVGHRYGPDSPEIAAAVARVDRTLGRLLDGIDRLPHADRVYVVLVSDHGMRAAPAEAADVIDMDRFPGVRLVARGPYASLFVEGGPVRHRAVRDSLAAMLPANDVYLRAEVPARLHYSADPRIGDLVVVAAPGRTVTDRLPSGDGFNHGWDNTVPEMGAIFLARGSGIQPGQRIPAFESVHVYPFLAHLLRLTPSGDIDGRLEVLWGILSN